MVADRRWLGWRLSGVGGWFMACGRVRRAVPSPWSPYPVTRAWAAGVLCALRACEPVQGVTAPLFFWGGSSRSTAAEDQIEHSTDRQDGLLLEGRHLRGLLLLQRFHPVPAKARLLRGVHAVLPRLQDLPRARRPSAAVLLLRTHLRVLELYALQDLGPVLHACVPGLVPLRFRHAHHLHPAAVLRGLPQVRYLRDD
eukprot:2114803-Prymnesium_polylepis.1